MFTNMIRAASLTAAIMIAGPVAAETWTLDGENSRLAFGSIKKGLIGEVHSFESLNGTVDAEGTVNIEIDLTSVETWIDIRNERMNEFVFQNTPKAMLSAKMDMDELNEIPVGGTSTLDVEGSLEFVGQSLELDVEMFVARIGEDKVMVTTNDMIFVDQDDLGMAAGLDKLMELAKLPSIARTSPVTIRLVFTLNDDKA